MSDQGIMTGRYNPPYEVGARLHRMATKENILQIMQGTTYNEKTDLNLKFKELKYNFKESVRQAQAQAEEASADGRAPSLSPAGSSGRGLRERARVFGYIRRVFSGLSGGGKEGSPPP